MKCNYRSPKYSKTGGDAAGVGDVALVGDVAAVGTMSVVGVATDVLNIIR